MRSRPASRGRIVLFLAGGVATVVLLVVVLIFLEQRSPVQSALPAPRVGPAPKNPSVRPGPSPPAPDQSSPSPAPETFTFYDTLEQRGTPHTGFPLKGTRPSAGSPPSVTAAPGPGVVSPQKSSPGYTVQIASIRDRATAEALTDRLRRKGYPAFILPHVVPKRGTWYRVRVGHFKQREKAQEMTQRLSGQERLMAYVARE